jgi:hypothetical protein
LQPESLGNQEPRRPSAATEPGHGMTKGERRMWLWIGIVLVLAWLGGFVVFHMAGFLIHILLILAVISIVFHFLRGSRTA